MAKISLYISEGNLGYHFHCEGCGSAHGVFTQQGEGDKVPIWEWNGSLNSPTFTPSIMVKHPHSSPENNILHNKFYKKYRRYPTLKELPYDRLSVCHSFVTNGGIRFLEDCTHHLKGQTVKLNDF